MLSTFRITSLVVALAYVLPQVPLRIPDLSYGIYVYHMPILLATSARGLHNWPLILAFTVGFSALSWYLVEKPVLSLKSRSRPTQLSTPNKPDEADVKV